MKLFCIIGLILIMSFNAMSQTPVDRLVDQLELFSEAKLDNWKYSTDFTQSVETISAMDFDDSGWKTLKINEQIFPDSCWLRKTVTLPEYIAGTPVKGKIRFLVSVDDYGYLFINGKTLGHFPWDGEFVLTEDAQPGTKYVMLIRAVNTGGPLRLMRAKLDFDQELPIQNLIRNVILSFKVGQKLLSFDTYQTNGRVKIDPGIDKSDIDRDEKIRLNELLQESAAIVDVDALRTGRIEDFKKSLAAVREKYQPVADFAKRFSLQFTANAHIDAAWLWRKKETVEVCHKTFASVLKMFEARPGFTFAQSQAVFYEWMEDEYPEIFKKIKHYHDENRWEIVGGMWVEPDCNLPDGISWARQFLYAQKYFENHFGRQATIGWNPDSFGYNWNLPQFFKLGGVDAFITQKIGWNDTNVFPYHVFWWQSPDGSKVLTYFPWTYVNRVDDPFGFADLLRQFEANTGFKKLMVLFGVGDHGGGPSLEMMARIDQLKTVDIYPRVEFGTSERYLDWLRAQDLSDLPVWNDELYLEYHRGTLTTQAETKAYNRQLETLIGSAEKFNAIAALSGMKYHHDDLTTAWKNVLFNQFHDILPGSSIHEVYVDSKADYEQSEMLADYVLRKSLAHLAGQINTSSVKDGKALIVFNPLSWARSDMVRVDLAEGDLAEYAVFDIAGREIPVQRLIKDKYHQRMLFYAEDIPALGYKVFQLRQQQPDEAKHTLVVNKDRIENERFKIEINPESGWIKTIYDKKLNRNLLSDEGNRLQILEDRPKEWDAWNIGLTGVEYPSNFEGAEIIEQGPVRAVLRLQRSYLKPGVKKAYPTEYFPSSFATQDIILYDRIERIDFLTTVDWWEDKTMLKVAFPLSVADTVATYEIPWGTIERSTTLKKQLDKGKWEVAALRWADLSEADYGVSLLNRAKYGYDIKDNVMRLSLLRSPKWPDPLADRGLHHIDYALYPHKGSYQDGNTIQRGYEYNTPLIAVISDAHPGALPEQQALIQVEPAGVIIGAIKQAEADEAWIVQMYESLGKDSEVRLMFPAAPRKVLETNFIEEDGEEVSFDGNSITILVKASAAKNLKIYF